MNKFELIGTVKNVYLDAVDIECDGELLEVQLNEAMCKYFIEIGDQLHIKGKICERCLQATNTAMYKHIPE